MSDRTLNIHFTDGTHVSFRFPKQHEEPHQLMATMQAALESDKLVLMNEAEGLFVFPTANIKYIRLEPAPEQVPPGAIRGAELLS